MPRRLVAVAGPAFSRGGDDRGCVRSTMSSTGAGVVVVSDRHRPQTGKSCQTVLTADCSGPIPRTVPRCPDGHVPGDPDLPGAHGDMKFKQPPVGGDRPARRCVQALVSDEVDGGWIGEPRPQQAALTVVVTDDDGSPAAMPSSANGTIRAANSDRSRRSRPRGSGPPGRVPRQSSSESSSMPSVRAEAPPAAALVAMNICVTSIASARPYLLPVSFSFSPACSRLAFFTAASAWAYGTPAAFPAARLAFLWLPGRCLRPCHGDRNNLLPRGSRVTRAPAVPRSASQDRSA